MISPVHNVLRARNKPHTETFLLNVLYTLCTVGSKKWTILEIISFCEFCNLKGKTYS
jgi:hypothetical protein